jgi:hypothetical protein
MSNGKAPAASARITEAEVMAYKHEVKTAALQLKTALQQAELYRTELVKSTNERESLQNEKIQLMLRNQQLQNEFGVGRGSVDSSRVH